MLIFDNLYIIKKDMYH